MIKTIPYSLEEIKSEVRQLVDQGLLERQQPLYMLCQYIAPREWICVELELEKNDYLLRDKIGDLLAHEEWEED
jgi:hypothetical protein